MLNFIDRFLNKITMYRLVLYYLITLVGIAVIFAAFGLLPYNPISIIFSAVFLTVIAWIANLACAKLLNAHPNVESVYITALILALIITPPTSVIGPIDSAGIIFLAWAAIFAMASKYIVAPGKKHIFNPAAFAVAVTALTIGQSASWWIGGNVPMMAFVIVGGLLVVRKIQRFDLATSFFIAALVSEVITHVGSDPLATIEKTLLHTPIFFFAAIMITEPLTTPPTREWRIVYGTLVGLLFSPFVHIGSIYSTPELALLAGNIFSYIVSPKGKKILTLKEKNETGTGIYDFVFVPDKKLKFRPGQYLEWTLAHPSPDTRGNRRYFTVASAPTEKTLRIGVKIHDPASSFKKNMLSMKEGDTIIAGQLAGDFVLPADTAKKLAFIAGGIGITPFRSMIKHMIDSGEHRDAVLFYSNRNTAEIAYQDVLDEAQEKMGMRTIYAITNENDAERLAHHHAGRISAELIKKELPDYRERIFYISGTRAMTQGFDATLRSIGVPRSHIKIDFFPGFA
jgi:ferredoxin-NADP reductase